MRRLEIGLGLSAVVHGAAIAWAVTGASAHTLVLAPAALAPITVATPPPPSPADVDVDAIPPLEVAFLAPDELVAPPMSVAEIVAAAATATPPPRPGAARPMPAAPATSRVETRPAGPPGDHAELAPGPDVGSGSAAPPGTKPSVLAMRSGPDLRSGIRGSYKDAYDLPAGTPPPEGPAPSGQLHATGGGRYGSDQGTFVVQVDPDGAAHIRDSGNLQGGAAPGGDGDSGENNNNNNAAPTGRIGATVAHFDVTDALMRHYGQDPYASRKLKVMDATRDERVEIGKAYRAKQLRQTPQIVMRNLARLFASVADAPARKQALFEMWDEVIDSGTDAQIEAGAAARKLVVAAIRSHFPAGSADAFSAAEVAALNARRTAKARFAPYD